MSEHEKRILKLTYGLAIKKLGKKAKPENIHSYLMSSKCEALTETVKILNYIADKTNSFHQKKFIKEFGEFGLWIAVNHPLYRKALEAAFKKFTNYKNTKIDLNPKMSKLELILFDSIVKYGMRKIVVRPTYREIITESLTSPNKIARYYMSNIDEVLVDVKSEFINNAIKSIAWLFIWIGVNDTAYRSQFYYAVNKIGNDKLKELSMDFYDEPDKWFINVYMEGRQQTIEKQKNKELPRHQTSIIEEQCVPNKQQEKINKILKKIGGVFWDA